MVNDIKKIQNTKIPDNQAGLSPLIYSALTDEMREFKHYFKSNWHILRKKIKKFLNRHRDQKFTNIVYVTAECPLFSYNSDRLDSPVEFISAIRKQYPDTNIVLLLPILGLDEHTKISKKITVDYDGNFWDLERTSINTDVFSANKSWECSLYKFSENEYNVTIYGIYSAAFSYLQNPKELNAFDKQVIFMKAVRSTIKNLKKEGFFPDIVHSECFPFFIGSEFEPKFPSNIRVLQAFDDFTKLEASKQEPFWSLINIADKKNMNKLFEDSYIQNCVSGLFNLPIKNITPKMQDCINLIYDNYKIFHKYNSSDIENKGDLLFKKLNGRVRKLFPNLFKSDSEHYYTFQKTISDCDFWAVRSKKYYKDLYEQNLASPEIMKKLLETKTKSGVLLPAICTHEDNEKYHNFDFSNYRDTRIKNKKRLVKEFSSDSIKTNFIDKTLFKSPDNIKIYGYFDTFYDAPLLFANPGYDIFSEGTDILFGTILKLFERNKNVQIITCIQDGLKQDYIKSVIKFLNENNIFMGHWVFIDGEINLPKFFAGADIYLHPARLCPNSYKHVLGSTFGCIPVVSKSGSLDDTVSDIFDDLTDGNGFKTHTNLLHENENTNIYVDTLIKALDIYNNNPQSWNSIIKNNLTLDSGWNFSKLEEYKQVYENLV